MVVGVGDLYPSPFREARFPSGLGKVNCAEPNSDRSFCQIKAVWIPVSWGPISQIVEDFGERWRAGVGQVARRVVERWDRTGGTSCLRWRRRFLLFGLVLI